MISRKLDRGDADRGAVLVAWRRPSSIAPIAPFASRPASSPTTSARRAFVSGLDPQTVFAETMDRAGIRRLRLGLSYRLDRTGQDRRCVAGGVVWQPRRISRGARLRAAARIERALSAQERHRRVEDAESSAAAGGDRGPGRRSSRPIPALKAALDHAFEEPATPPFRRTKAVVVVHDGRVIAERYAAGIGVDTPLLGFSMTKSRDQRADRHPDPARPHHAVVAGADPGMARRHRPAPRDRGRASDADDHGAGAGRNQQRLRSVEPDGLPAQRHGRICREGRDDRPAGQRAGPIPARPRSCWRGSSATPSAVPSRRWRSRGASCSIRWACAA